jgi:hypothetical protein
MFHSRKDLKMKMQGILAVFLFMVACSMVSCKGSDGSNDPSTGRPPFQLSSLNEQCGDQTATGLLSHLKAQYDATFQTLPAFSSLLTATAVTIHVAYQGGSLTCYPAYTPPPGSTVPASLDQIGIVSHVEFVTAGGAFQEKLDTELKGRSEGSTGSVEFSHDFKVEDIQGTYRPDLPGYVGQFVSIGGRLSDDSTDGSIEQGGQLPGHASQIIFVAVWNSN